MKAVHFGAGNIGRGFVGLILSEAGYEVVFSDVDASLIGALREAGSYTVHEVGDGARDHLVTGFRAVDGRVDEDALVEEIATADVVTTAVGPNVLRFVAPAIAAGLLARSPKRPPLVVMACENAIRATDTLKACILEEAADRAADADARAIFANTAVDRIVPGVPGGGGLDVTVEAFHEWVIEGPPFGDNPPVIPGAHVVDDLDPYIERKLFTVNTGHAATAYIGFLRGAETIAEAISTPEVADAVRRALEETSALLVEKHGLDEQQQAAYRERILARFANPHLPDTVVRVGRQPLRKLSRHERFIGPAAEIAEAGREPSALLAAVSAALRFDVPSDDESVDLQELLGSQDADAFTAEVTGLEASHPLYAAVRDAVAEVQAAR